MTGERGDRIVRIVREIDAKALGGGTLSALDNAIIMNGHELPDGSIVATFSSRIAPIKLGRHERHAEVDDSVDPGTHFEGDF